MPRRCLVSFTFALMVHGLVVAALVWWSLPETASDAATSKPEEAVSAVAATPAPPGAPPTEAEERDEIGKYLPRPPAVRVWGFEFDVRKIRERWSELFPFVTAPPSFESAPRFRLASGRMVFVDPQAPPPALPPGKPPLAMSRTAIQALMDRTWSRRDRWDGFGEIVKLANAYDANEGRLADVVRAYVEQNALQPYEDTTLPDPRRWALLALAADHRDFVDFLAGYVRDHPGTRTSTEMLFLVDALMQGSRETLQLLLETSPPRHLSWTRQESYEGYVLFGALREYYGAYLDKRGLGDREAIDRQYDELRRQLLTMLVSTTPNGYRASDAHFLMGRMRWTQGDPGGAVREWREMRVTAGDRFARPSSEILRVLEGHTDPQMTPDSTSAARISAILDAERRAWVAFQFNRLRTFGHGFYTF